MLPSNGQVGAHWDLDSCVEMCSGRKADPNPPQILRRLHNTFAIKEDGQFYTGRPQSLSSAKVQMLKSASWHESMAMVPLSGETNQTPPLSLGVSLNFF